MAQLKKGWCVIMIMEDIAYYKEKLASIQDMFSMTTRHLNRVQSELKEAHEALSQSVRYAEKIQAQIVPAFNQTECVFHDHYFYLNQRDGVGGDFIYINQQGDNTIFGLMDCTGHGVPGALLAVMGYNFINDIIHSNNLTEPDDILTRLNLRINDYFKTKNPEETLRDGMDGIICTYNKPQRKLKYSLAGRPLLLMTNNEWTKIRASRNSIGGLKQDFFEQREITITAGDEICMFSDGLSDQFGGPNDKKFSTRKIIEHLSQHQGISPTKKGQKLVNKLLEWQGDKTQTDDISYLSIKF